MIFAKKSLARNRRWRALLGAKRLFQETRFRKEQTKKAHYHQIVSGGLSLGFAPRIAVSVREYFLDMGVLLLARDYVPPEVPPTTWVSMVFSNRVRTICFAYSLTRKHISDFSEPGRSKIWRRGGDLNSGYPYEVYSLSRGAPSAARPPLRGHAKMNSTCTRQLY